MADDYYRTVSVPRTRAFVLVGWGDATDDQTCSIFHDDVKPGEDYSSGMTRLQRQMMALRLRYVADLIDPDKVWDL